MLSAGQTSPNKVIVPVSASSTSSSASKENVRRRASCGCWVRAILCRVALVLWLYRAPASLRYQASNRNLRKDAYETLGPKRRW